MRGSLCAVVIAISTFAGAQVRAEDAPWPDFLVLSNGSQSPDGKYGVLVPDSAAGLNAIVDYLADLKTRQKLGPIPAVEYYQSENHGGLIVKWTDDSSCCLVVHESRGLMEFLALIDVSAKPTAVMTDLGERIRKELTSSIPKKARTDGVGDLEFHSRFGGDGTVKLRAVTEFDQAGRTTFFQGTYNIRDRKWTAVAARLLTKSQATDISIAYQRADDDSAVDGTEDEQIAQLNNSMGKLLRGLGAILPGEAQAKLSGEQKLWLQKRKASDSKSAELKLLSERVNALRDRCWQGSK